MPRKSKPKTTLKSGKTQIVCTEYAKILDMDGFPIAQGEGVITVKVHEPTDVFIDTVGNFRIVERAINQTCEPSSDIILTTLDRPDPMSPEMAAIMRMQRKNEIQREMDRAYMEQKYAALENARRNSSKLDETNQAKPKQQDDKGSSKGDATPAGGDDNKPPKSAAGKSSDGVNAEGTKAASE